MTQYGDESIPLFGKNAIQNIEQAFAKYGDEAIPIYNNEDLTEMGMMMIQASGVFGWLKPKFSYMTKAQLPIVSNSLSYQ